VFSRGLLTGSKPTQKGDFRAFLPRFTGDNGAKNEAVVARLRAFADERGVTPAQLVLAWVLAKEPTFLPVVGARTRKQVDDALGALEKPLSKADVSALEAIVPHDAIAGTRYAADQMKHLDSERA
jgi:aryl-alcohol dehydrogenase-like predicted oxidoreductase